MYTLASLRESVRVSRLGVGDDDAAEAAAEAATKAAFAVEKSPRGAERLYRHCDVRAFAEEMQALPAHQRRAHEVLQPDIPYRVFVDLDGLVDEGEGEGAPGGRADIDAALAAVVAHITSVFGGAYADDRVELDASRPKKASMHVTFPSLILPSLACVRDFILSLPVAHPCLDLNVYAHWRCFRTPFSTGYMKDTNIGGVDFDCGVFLRGLVGVYCGKQQAGEVQPYVIAGDTHARAQRHISSSSSSISDFGWTRDEIDCARGQIENTLIGVVVSPSSSSQDSGRIEFHIRGGVCAKKGASHRSNCMYLHVNIPYKPSAGFTASLASPGYYVCTDAADCGNYRWLAGDFAFAFEFAAAAAAAT